jgi:DNA polymerase III subunit delta'
MADAEADEAGRRHPRLTAGLVGHEAAEAALLEAYRGGRMPHAWLLAGPSGIGKATLAYRMARFALAYPDPAMPAVQSAVSLAVDLEHRTFRRVAAQAHSDLLALERVENDKGRLQTVITVDQVRRTVSFFGSTAGEGGWRICIVDTVDDLNAYGLNALLKILEEPPARSLLLLVSHAPGRLPPTIRSRCRRLTLRPLSPAQVASVASAAIGRPEDDADVAAAALAAAGSAGVALALLEGGLIELRRRVNTMLEALPAVDPLALHALGDEIAGAEAEPLQAVVEVVQDWLSQRLAAPEAEVRRLAQVAEVWDKVTRAARDAESYNLDRKPLVFNMFAWLAEAAR